MDLQPFFYWARERYKVMMLKKSGAPKPWTEESVLQDFRFCNVFREDDKVTQWFRENVREPMRDSREVVFACTAFRFFNLPSTAQVMLDYDLFGNWRSDTAREVLFGLKPMITGAYMVKTPLRKPKLEGLIEILDPIWHDNDYLRDSMINEGSLQSAHQYLMSFPWVGPFMAYQAVCDLRFTHVLENAEDINSWTCLGPGSARGLSRILYGDPGKLTAGSAKSNEIAIPAMIDILAASNNEEYWPGSFPKWELSTVQHWLCEYDKIMRTQLGEGTPKQRYNGRD